MQTSISVQFSSLQSLSCVWLFATPWTGACQASLSIANSQNWLKLMCIESVMPSSHLILCHPLLLLLPPFPPSIRVFSNASTLHMRWPKYWSFSFSISPSDEYSGLISFRIDWFDLLAVQGTLRVSSNTMFKSIKSLALSFLHSPTLTSVRDYWKNHSFNYTDLCWQNNVSAFNMLSTFVIAFLPRNKYLLISWLQSLSTVILEPKKIKSVAVSTIPLLFAMKWCDWMPWC